MPGVIVGLMIGLMGLAWFMQRPTNQSQASVWHKPTSTVVMQSSNPVLSSNPLIILEPPPAPKSEAVVVNSIDVSPMVCKPIETDEQKPLIRNLTRPFEQREYILKPGEQCTPE